MILRADARATPLKDESVDSIVTDPPYELGFMGKKWDSSGVAYRVDVWAEALRVLKPGGHLLAFGGSRTYHRMACAIEDAGFEIRDQIQWIYGSGFPKSKNIGGGWGTALKPAHEPIVMARKPLIGTVAENVQAHGTGAINVDGCRVETSDTYAYPNGPVGCKSSEFHYQGRSEKPAESNPLGRWPANVIHDGSEEVLEQFPEATGQQGDVRGTEPSCTGDENTVAFGKFNRVAFRGKRNDSGSASRFFYCAKASKEDRDWALEKGNHHPTVKPIDLMRYLCRLVTPPGGIVLDPFAGSGSTLRAAFIEGFKPIGIEISDEYCRIARARMNLLTPTMAGLM